MPWMVSSDPTTDRIRDAVRSAWPTRTARLDRLYAFGFDAYRLVPALRANSLSESNILAGVTGRLHLDQHNKIRRDLDWSQIRNGTPTEVPAQL
jgi:outer membrane PBP1 activator LpoA protein